MPPVSRRLTVRSLRLVASGRASEASARTSLVIGNVFGTATLPTSAAAPSERIAGMVALLKGVSALAKRDSDGASAPRASVTGLARAELVEEDREALAERQAHDVVEQVEVDRVLGVGHRQQVLARALLALRDDLQRRRHRIARRARLGRRALDVLLADQRLRADAARRVGAEVGEARLVDLEDDGGLVVGRDRQRVDLAHLDAGDLDVLALDDREGRVEDRAHLVRAARA